MNCKVSVIVPVYAVAAYIGRCAESLFGQTLGDVEYIFVDNNTPDDSVGILRSVLSAYPSRQASVRIIREEKQGLGYARFAGLRAASGEYVIHVDSDDWVEPDYLERLVAKAEDENADVVYCDYFKEYENRPGKTKVVRQKDLPDTSSETAVLAMYRSGIKAFMWNKLEKRSLYDLDTLVVPVRNMHEDLVFQSQIVYSASKVVHLAVPLYHYLRKRSGAVTAGSVLRNRRISAEGLFHLYRSLPKRGSHLEYAGYDLAGRAAWYALCSLDLSLLKSAPGAVAEILESPVRSGLRVSRAGQRILKFVCRFLSR